MNAPIVVFAYNRPDKLKLVLEALRRNPEAHSSELYVFCDGPKKIEEPLKQEREISRHSEVSNLAQRVEGFERTRVILREKNLGLARSLIAGITEVCSQHGTAIVVEDDLVVSEEFLAYMNFTLQRYRNEPRVASISGYMYPTAERTDLPDSFFLRGAECWGWGTWKRSWDLFDSDGTRLLAQLREHGLETEFNPGARGPYLEMLRSQIEGKVDSWAIRWHASMFVRNMVTLYPKCSLVKNIGFGADATHTSDAAEKKYAVDGRGHLPTRFPDLIEENAEARHFMHNFFNQGANTAAGGPRNLYKKMRAIAGMALRATGVRRRKP